MNNAHTVRLDTSQIPEYERDLMAAATLRAVGEFLAKPGGREYLEARIAERKEKNKEGGGVNGTGTVSGCI